jgi:hypothetical protein
MNTAYKIPVPTEREDKCRDRVEDGGMGWMVK